MVLQPPKPDDYVTCPFDKYHRILRSRMQYHIVRCFKNHKDVTKIRCPWNPLHFVERCEYLDHCSNKCEDLTNVMGSKIEMGEAVGRDVASIPVSSIINAPVPHTDENWDMMECAGTYNPQELCLERPILRSSMGLSKAKKKEFRLEERKRHQQLEAELPLEMRSPAKLAGLPHLSVPPRRPYNPSLALSADASMLDETNKSCEDSKEGEKCGKISGNLRQPHGLSPGLLLKATEHNEFTKGTLFDRQLEDNSKADSDFYALSTSPRSGDKTIQQEKLEKPKVEMMEGKEIPLQDGAACLLPKITDPSDTDDEVAKLTEELADIEIQQRFLGELRAELLQKILKNGVKYRTIDDFQSNQENFSHNCNLKFTGINRKCAATFGGPKNEENPPKLGFGRGGIPFDFESLEKWKPIGIRQNQQDSATADSPDAKKDETKE